MNQRDIYITEFDLVRLRDVLRARIGGKARDAGQRRPAARGGAGDVGDRPPAAAAMAG